jgi:hypothetical protein
MQNGRSPRTRGIRFLSRNAANDDFATVESDAQGSARSGGDPRRSRRAMVWPGPLVLAGDVLRDVLSPQIRVVFLERAHHVHAPLIVKNDYLNAAGAQ